MANPAPKTVCLDFDGVLADYHGWKDIDTLDLPYPGAKEFVRRCVDAGYAIKVHTTRKAHRVWDWLQENGFEGVDSVTNLKPKAMVYIDDRGHRFTGDWDAAYAAIEQPTHWETK